MALPKTVVSETTDASGKKTIYYSDGSMSIKNPGRAYVPPKTDTRVRGEGGSELGVSANAGSGVADTRQRGEGGSEVGVVANAANANNATTATAPNYDTMNMFELGQKAQSGDAAAKAAWETRTHGQQMPAGWQDPNHLAQQAALNPPSPAASTSPLSGLGLQGPENTSGVGLSTTGTQTANAGAVTGDAGTGAATGTQAAQQTYTKGQTIEQGAKMWDGEKLVPTPVGTSLENGYWDGTKVIPYFEGMTRGQGSEIYKNGAWVPNELPSNAAKVETPLTPQDPNNAFSNAMALGRGAASEFAPESVSASDVAKEATGYGMDRFTNTDQLRDQELAQTQAEQVRQFEKQMEEMRNRYQGVGVSGLQQRREMDTARDFALGRGRTDTDIRTRFNELGFNRNKSLLDAAQNLSQGNQAAQANTFANVLGAAQGQSAQAVNALQQERARAYDQWKYLNQEQAITARGDAERNSQTRQALWTALFSMLPKPATPEQQAMMLQAQAIAKNAGIDYQPGTGNASNVFDEILKSTGLSDLLPEGFDLGAMFNLAKQFGAN